MVGRFSQIPKDIKESLFKERIEVRIYHQLHYRAEKEENKLDTCCEENIFVGYDSKLKNRHLSIVNLFQLPTQ